MEEMSDDGGRNECHGVSPEAGEASGRPVQKPIDASPEPTALPGVLEVGGDVSGVSPGIIG